MTLAGNTRPAQEEGRGEHKPYTLGMLYNDELSPQEVQTHRETDRPTEQLPLHSHLFWEIGCVTGCSGAEYVIGTDQYRIQPGDILFIPSETIHGPVFRSDRHEPCIRDVIWISPHFLSRLARMQPNAWFYETGKTRLFRTAGTRWAELADLFERGIGERQKRQFGWEAMVVGNTMILLSQLCRAMLDESMLVLKEEKSDLLFRILGHLEEHLGDKLTLESVASRFDVSKSTVTQLFRKKLDTSFYAYLTKRRLACAKGLIVRGTPLEQVGKAVGFKEHSAFYRAFRQEFGISPREYRLSVRAEEDGPPAQKESH